jgi:hypothetical protein
MHPRPSRPAQTSRRPPQGQRALKRQKSLPNGDPSGLLGSPPGGGGAGGYAGVPGGAAAGAGDGDWMRKCYGVLNAIYSDIGPKEFCYNLPAKDVFYKTVSETFPGIAPQYYSVVRNPVTFRDIETRLKNGAYDGPQTFADVSGRAGLSLGGAAGGGVGGGEQGRRPAGGGPAGAR